MIEIAVKVNRPGDPTRRDVVTGKVVKSNAKTFWVELEDGSIVKRKWGRDEVK